MQERTTAEIIKEYRMAANEYNLKMSDLAKIRRAKAIKIIELMAEHKTVSRAELYFSASTEGQLEIQYSMEAKGLEKIISSLNAELRAIRDDNYNAL